MFPSDWRGADLYMNSFDLPEVGIVIISSL